MLEVDAEIVQGVGAAIVDGVVAWCLRMLAEAAATVSRLNLKRSRAAGLKCP